MPTLKTPRLTLRPFRLADWKAVHEYASDPEVTRYTHFGPNTIKETKDFLKKAITNNRKKKRSAHDFAIILNEEQKLIGGCALYISDMEEKECAIGYTLNKKYWGKGYATETAKALLKYGFQKLEMHRIAGYCFPGNARSQHVLEKIGMQYEGIARKNIQIERTKEWTDTFQYAILEDEYKV